MYLRYLKLEFFEIRPHPRISLALARYAVAVYSRRAALVYEKLSCLVNGMYLYVLVRTFQEILYWYVPVCTGMYRYVQVHTILPDPGQVYRIPHVCMYFLHTSTYLRENVCTRYILGVKSMYRVHTGLCWFI